MALHPEPDQILSPSLKILDTLGALTFPQKTYWKYLKESINIILVSLLILGNISAYSFILKHFQEFELVTYALSGAVFTTTAIVAIISLKLHQKDMHLLLKRACTDIIELQKQGDVNENKMLFKFYKDSKIYKVFLFGFPFFEILIFVPYFVWSYITLEKSEQYQTVLIYLSLPFEDEMWRNFVKFFICVCCSWHLILFHSSANHINIFLLLDTKLKLNILNYRIRNIGDHVSIIQNNNASNYGMENILEDIRYNRIKSCVKTHLQILRY